MKKDHILLLSLSLTLSLSLPVFADSTTPTASTVERENPYAYTVQEADSTAAVIQFAGNSMTLNHIQIGYNSNGSPMISLRTLSETFGFKVQYDAKTASVTVTRGRYGFSIHTGIPRATLLWDGKIVRETDLTQKPLIQNGKLYLYSLDLSDLMGLVSSWDDSNRTWQASCPDYQIVDNGYTDVFPDTTGIVKWLLINDGIDFPELEITPQESSTGFLSPIHPERAEAPHYQAETHFVFKTNPQHIREMIHFKDRILFIKDLDVSMDPTLKTLENTLPDMYQFTQPAQGYTRKSTPSVLLEGTVNDKTPGNLRITIHKVNSKEEDSFESLPYSQGAFSNSFTLKNGAGLYKIQVCYPMAGPHGTAYVTLLDFFIAYEPHS